MMVVVPQPTSSRGRRSRGRNLFIVAIMRQSVTQGSGGCKVGFGRPYEIYDASQFSHIDPGGAYITEIFFRADSSIRTVGALVTNIQVNQSTTSQSVTNLSPVFANNVGRDESV